MSLPLADEWENVAHKWVQFQNHISSQGVVNLLEEVSELGLTKFGLGIILLDSFLGVHKTAVFTTLQIAFLLCQVTRKCIIGLHVGSFLLPGGSFIWYAAIFNLRVLEDVGIGTVMSESTKSISWELLAIRTIELKQVTAATYWRTSTNKFYSATDKTRPPCGSKSADPRCDGYIFVLSDIDKLSVCVPQEFSCPFSDFTSLQVIDVGTTTSHSHRGALPSGLWSPLMYKDFYELQISTVITITVLFVISANADGQHNFIFQSRSFSIAAAMSFLQTNSSSRYSYGLVFLLITIASHHLQPLVYLAELLWILKHKSGSSKSTSLLQLPTFTLVTQLFLLKHILDLSLPATMENNESISHCNASLSVILVNYNHKREPLDAIFSVVIFFVAYILVVQMQLMEKWIPPLVVNIHPCLSKEELVPCWIWAHTAMFSMKVWVLSWHGLILVKAYFQAAFDCDFPFVLSNVHDDFHLIYPTFWPILLLSFPTLHLTVWLRYWELDSKWNFMTMDNSATQSVIVLSMSHKGAPILYIVDKLLGKSYQGPLSKWSWVDCMNAIDTLMSMPQVEFLVNGPVNLPFVNTPVAGIESQRTLIFHVFICSGSIFKRECPFSQKSFNL